MASLETVALMTGLGEKSAGLAGLLQLSEPGYVLALRICGSRHAAEDALQQAYLNACRHLRQNPSPRELRTWFLTVVANEARKHLRGEARRARRESAVEVNQIDRPPELNAEVSELRRALQGLDSELRAAVSLCYEQELTQREAAAVLGIPKSTLADRVEEGLKKLRRSLEKAGYPAAAAGVVEGLRLTSPTLPAGLAAKLETLVAGALGAKTALAGGAAAAAGAGLIWKALAGLAATALLVAGFWGGWQVWRSRPAPDPERTAAAAPPAQPTAAKPEARVTLNVGREYVTTVLEAIHRQTGVSWGLPHLNMWTDRVEVDGRDRPLREILAGLSRQSGLAVRHGPRGEILLNFEHPDLEFCRRALEAAREGTEEERASACWALGTLDDMRALPHLVAGVEDESLLVRCWSAKALWNIMVYSRGFVRHAGQMPDHWKLWLSGKQRNRLLAALLKPGALGSRAAAPPKYPGHPGRRMRLELLACLDNDARAEQAILAALGSRDGDTVSAALSAVRVSGRSAYLEPVLKLLRGAEKKLRFTALHTLLRIRSERAGKEFLHFVRKHKLSPGERTNLLASMKPGTSSWALPWLFECLEKGGSTSGNVQAVLGWHPRSEAENAHIVRRLAEVAAKGPKNAAAREAVQVLARLGMPAGVETVDRYLKRASLESEVSLVLYSLQFIPNRLPGLEDAVLKWTRKKSKGSTRLRAIAALGRCGAARGSAYLEKLATEAADPDPRKRVDQHIGVVALRALKRLDTPEARAALRAVARKANSEDVRFRAELWLATDLAPEQAARQLLAACEHPRAKAPVKKLTWHDRFPLRNLATSLSRNKPCPQLSAGLGTMSRNRLPQVRLAALEGMRWFPGEDFLPLVLKLLSDRNPAVAQAAQSVATNMLRRPPNMGRRRLLALLRSPRAPERLIALTNLRLFAPCPEVLLGPDFAKVLAAAAEGRTAAGKAARGTMMQLASPRAVGWKLALLRDENAEQKLRGDALRSLASWMGMRHFGSPHDPRIRPALAEYMKNHPQGLKPGYGRTPKPKEPPEVF